MKLAGQTFIAFIVFGSISLLNLFVLESSFIKIVIGIFAAGVALFSLYMSIMLLINEEPEDTSN